MTAADGHIIAPDNDGPYDTCERCGLAIQKDIYGRGLITMITGNTECYGTRSSYR